MTLSSFNLNILILVWICTPLSCMNLTPKKQIEKAIAAFENECALHKGCNYPYCPNLERIYTRHRTVLAQIVRDAGNQLSKQEKLMYLIGDEYENERKELLKIHNRE